MNRNLNFIDDDDFTSDHDMIFRLLMNNWVQMIGEVHKGKYFDEKTNHFDGITGISFEAEPCLNGYPPLFPDARCRFNLYSEGEMLGQHEWLIEIKPRIDSLGKVLRQLNLYRKRTQCQNILLITGDDRFSKEIASQGYTVVYQELPIKEKQSKLNIES